MMKTMFGRCVCCAATGVLTTIAAANIASKPSQSLPKDMIKLRF
jgi:hypothetical protein